MHPVTIKTTGSYRFLLNPKGFPTLSAWPEVRGTADTDGGAYSSSGQSSSYTLKTLSSSRSTGRRAVTDMNVKTRTLRCAPFLHRLRRRECCMLGATSSQPTVPLHELRPARLVVHRQTSLPMNDVRGRGMFNRGRAY